MLDVMACGLGAMLLLFIGMVLRIRSSVEDALALTAAVDPLEVEDLEQAIRSLEDETKSLEEKAEDLRQDRWRAEAYALSSREELERLKAEKEALEALLDPRDADRARESSEIRSVPTVEVSRLGIKWRLGENGEFFVYVVQPGSSLDLALQQVGWTTPFELVSVGLSRAVGALDLIDALANLDPQVPVRLGIRQGRKEMRIEVRPLAVRIFEDEPLPLPPTVRHLDLVLQADRNLGRHVAAMAARVLQLSPEVETVTIVRLGRTPMTISSRDGRSRIPRTEFAVLVEDLPALLVEDVDEAPDQIRGLGLLGDGKIEEARHVLSILTRPPPHAQASVERCLAWSHAHRATLSGIALRGSRSPGLADYLSLLAEQTGGGFLGVHK